MTVTIYSLPNCVQCDMTKKLFARENVEYTAIDLSTDSEANDFVKGLGYQSAPVVVVDGMHWSGFKRDKIMTVATEWHALHAKAAAHAN